MKVFTLSIVLGVLVQAQGVSPQVTTMVKSELLAAVEVEMAKEPEGWQMTRREIHQDLVAQDWNRRVRRSDAQGGNSPDMHVGIHPYSDEERAKKAFSDGRKRVQVPPTGRFEGLADEAWFTKPAVRGAPFQVAMRKGAVLVYVDGFEMSVEEIRRACEVLVKGIETYERARPKEK